MSSVFEDILTAYNVPWISEGQNSSKSFINICCPPELGCCPSDQKFKLGLSREGTFCNCWSGGGHPIKKAIESLGVPWPIWKAAIDEVEGLDWKNLQTKTEDKNKPIEDILIPGEPLHKIHKQYLRERGFDPEFLEKEFGLRGILYPGQYYSGTAFAYEDKKLANRIIIPIYYEGKAISYLGRTYLKDIKNRYMCANPELESFFHKHSFYNIDKATGEKIILCEGTLDCMKLVQGSGNYNIIASYGTQITDEQLQLLRKRYKEVIIMYDGEEKAQEKALKIKTYLESYGVKCRNFCLKGDLDPGDLKNEQAKMLVEHLLGKE